MIRCYSITALAVALVFSAASVGHAQWIRKANFPGGSTDAAVEFAIDGKLYFGGGSGAHTTFYQYDPAANKWTKKANIPTAKDYRGFATSFVIGSKGYVTCGQSDLNVGQPSVTNDLWEYDPAADKWTQKADFPGVKRDGAFAFVIGTKAYVGGGVDQGAAFVGDFFEYDPAHDTWTGKADLTNGALGFPMAFAIGGKGYVVAGGQGSEVTDANVYDPVKDEWNAIAPFPGEGREAGIGYAIDTIGYVGLGEASYSKTYSDLYAYNPKTDSWTAQPGLPFTNGVAWPAVAVLDGSVFVGGGAAIVGPNLEYIGPGILVSSVTQADVAEVPNAAVRVFPNPSSRSVQISIGGTLRIEDELGRTVLERTLASGESIGIESLSAGVYHYALRTTSGVVRGNLVKE